jgi:hypothetical protein
VTRISLHTFGLYTLHHIVAIKLRTERWGDEDLAAHFQPILTATAKMAAAKKRETKTFMRVNMMVMMLLFGEERFVRFLVDEHNIIEPKEKIRYMLRQYKSILPIFIIFPY